MDDLLFLFSSSSLFMMFFIHHTLFPLSSIFFFFFFFSMVLLPSIMLPWNVKRKSSRCCWKPMPTPKSKWFVMCICGQVVLVFMDDLLFLFGSDLLFRIFLFTFYSPFSSFSFFLFFFFFLGAGWSDSPP